MPESKKEETKEESKLQVVTMEQLLHGGLNNVYLKLEELEKKIDEIRKLAVEPTGE